MGTRVWPYVFVLGFSVLGLHQWAQAQAINPVAPADPDWDVAHGEKRGQPVTIQEQYEALSQDKVVVIVVVKMSYRIHANGPRTEKELANLAKAVMESKLYLLVATQESQVSTLTALTGFEPTRRAIMSDLQGKLLTHLASGLADFPQYSDLKVEVLSWTIRGEEEFRRKRAEDYARAKQVRQQAMCLKEKMEELYRRLMKKAHEDARKIQRRQEELLENGRHSTQERREIIEALERKLSSARDEEKRKREKVAEEECRRETRPGPVPP